MKGGDREGHGGGGGGGGGWMMLEPKCRASVLTLLFSKIHELSREMNTWQTGGWALKAETRYLFSASVYHLLFSGAHV